VLARWWVKVATPSFLLTGADRAGLNQRRNAMRLIQSLLLALALSLPMVGFAAEPVNINTASATAIADSLNGVGEAKAKAIVEYREKNGPFKSADELANVKGIGLKTIEKNRELIRVAMAPAKS
jgi:competence protein ComEA